MKIKLFEFSHASTKEKIYLYSVESNEKYLRQQLACQDHGDTPCEEYSLLHKEGTIKEIRFLNQVDEEYRNYIIYKAEELDSLCFSYTIKEYFEKSGKMLEVSIPEDHLKEYEDGRADRRAYFTGASSPIHLSCPGEKIDYYQIGWEIENALIKTEAIRRKPNSDC